MSGNSAKAQSLFWGATGSGGGGTWNTTSANWYNGITNVVWASNNTAVFSGSPGNVSVSGSIPGVNGLTFSVSGYSLSGGTLSLNGSFAEMNVVSGAASINSTLTGFSQGINKIGVGTLTLRSASLYTGMTIVSAGTLGLTRALLARLLRLTMPSLRWAAAPLASDRSS